MTDDPNGPNPIDSQDEPFPEEPAEAQGGAVPEFVAAPEDVFETSPQGGVQAQPQESPDEDEEVFLPDDPDPEVAAPPAVPAAATVTGRIPAPARVAVPRPDLLDRQEPLYRSFAGYRLRLEPQDLARLRELPGSRGKSDDELGESFFDGQAERLAASVAGDVPDGAELRVVVDPYSRQAFVALDKQIRGILSF